MTSIHENKCYVILHGHFYQPPRENPWLGFIEPQESAAPFRHWTERITEECYRANAFSPLLARGGRIASLMNNFEHLSFNVGPTLLEWLEPNAPDVYRRIVEGDRIGAGRRDGHGNAMAQGYNHTILPLCSPEDRQTQIRWGLDDFHRRFGRPSEGIWLPETAVDLDTIEALISNGVTYAVLAPSQLEATRPLAGGEWQAATDPGSIMHHRAYRLFGRDRDAGHLDVFFFHPAISREISFDHLLRDGRTFARRLERAFDQKNPEVQALVVATDGETFGHHEPFANMCLTWLFSQPPEKLGFRLTNFGSFLQRFPPRHEARLQPGPDNEGTAWSCAHGVGRWSRDCGCATGADEGWNQQWRTPLRDGLNGLRERVSTVLQREGHTPGHPAADTGGGASPQSRMLNELHYYSQLMFTSCGWFFNDISGLEPVQNLFYARRVAELLERHFGEQAEDELLTVLARAKSNLSSAGSGARIYRREVVPRTLDVEGLVAAAALLSSHGIEQPLDPHGDHQLEQVAVEQVSRGDLTMEAGWSRLHSRPGWYELRPFLHLVLRGQEGGVRAWADQVETGKAESAYRNLLASLARSSEDDILTGFHWRFHPERRLPPVFAVMIEQRMLRRHSESAAVRAMELYGTGRDLFVRADRDWKTGLRGSSSPALLALARLFAEEVRLALADGDHRAQRQVRGMRRMARALELPLDTTAGEAVLQTALADQLDHPRLLDAPAPVRQALRLARMGKGMGLDPAGNRALQIRYWGTLERGAGTDGSLSDLPSGILLLGELLGFHRRSLVRRFKDPSGE